jgi:glutamate synthase domain-containing protein 3
MEIKEALETYKRNLEGVKKTAAGTLGYVLGDLISTPKATLDGMAAFIHGKSAAEASIAVREHGASTGQRLFREHSDLVVDILREAIRIVAEDHRRRQTR